MSVSLKVVARNASSNVTRFALAGLVRFFLTPFIVFHLGAEGYGLWALALAAIGLLSLLEFGFGTAVVWATARFDPNDPQRRLRRLSTLAALHLGLTFLTLPLLAGLIFYFPSWFDVPPQHLGAGRLILLFLGLRFALIAIPFGFFKNVLFGLQHISAINLVQIVIVLLYALTVWLVLSQGGTIVHLAIIHLVMGFLEYMAYAGLYFRLASPIKLSWRSIDLRLTRELLSFSASSFIIGISGFILLKTDPILVQLGLSLSAVALYAIALKVVENLHLLLKQVVNVLSPVVADLDSDGHTDALRFIFTHVARHALWVGSLPAAALFVLGHPFLTLWIAPDFGDAAPTLSVLLFAMTLVIPQLVASNIMTMVGRHQFIATASLFGALLNVGASLLFLFIFDLGLLGIALGTLTAVLFVDCGLILWRTCRHLQLRYLHYLRTVFLPAFFCGLMQWIVTAFLASLFSPTHLLHLSLLALPGVLLSAALYLRFYALADLRRWRASRFSDPRNPSDSRSASYV